MIYLNGKLCSPTAANVAVNDRGLLLGDGLFDTLRAEQGKIRCLNAHWRRILDGLTRLNIPLPLTLTQFTQAIASVLQANNLLATSASLRLTITRGAGPRGLNPPAVIKPTYFLTATPLIPTANAVNVVIADIKRNEYSPLASIKSLNYLDNVLARTDAVQKNAQEALLFNTQGNLACATAANVFLIHQGTLYTPALNQGIIPGITRATVLKIATTLKIPTSEIAITHTRLLTADEVFLTNSLIGIQTIKRIDAHPITSAVITEKIKTAFNELNKL